MKRVNLGVLFEQKKKEVMSYFEQDNEPQPESAAAIKAAAEQDPTAGSADDEVLIERIIEALKTIYDPEIPVNIYDLGLIYAVRCDAGEVSVDMTLTTPGCPVAETFPGMVERSVELVPGVKNAAVELVWDPPWTQDRLSEAARLELGLI